MGHLITKNLVGIPNHIGALLNHPLYFLIGGQSNASGSAIVLGGETNDNPDIQMFGNDYVLKQAYEPVDDWTNQVDIVSSSTAPLTNMHGFSLKAAKEVSISKNNCKVTLIPCAKGGTPITDWLPTADRFDRSTLFGSANHRRLVAAKGFLKSIWWYGHESSAWETFYTAQWQTLVSDLRESYGFVPIIYAQLGKHQTASINKLQNRTADFQRIQESGVILESLILGSPVVDVDFSTCNWGPNSPENWGIINNDANNYLEKLTTGMHVVNPSPLNMRFTRGGVCTVGQKYYIEIVVSEIVSGALNLYGNSTYYCDIFKNLDFYNGIFTADATGLTWYCGSPVPNNITIKSIKVSPYISGNIGSSIEKHNMVVTFDLPLTDIIHLDTQGQIELGRRFALATRQHVLKQNINGTGPRLVFANAFTHPLGDKSKVKITFNKAINDGSATKYNGQFRVYDGITEMTVSSAVRDVDGVSVLITMSAAAVGLVTVSYGDVAATGTGIWLTDVVKDSDNLPAPQFSAQRVI